MKIWAIAHALADAITLDATMNNTFIHWLAGGYWMCCVYLIVIALNVALIIIKNAVNNIILIGCPN